jgi:hypothetical protein
MPNYHFRLPDGQEHGWNGTANALKKAHPDATITGRVQTNEVTGDSVLAAYQGEQPPESPAAPVAVEVTVTEDAKPKSAASKSSKA